MAKLPQITEDMEPTRATLHAYARVVGEVARAHAIAHPKWWHVSLAVRPEGFVTDSIPLSDGGAFGITIDPVSDLMSFRSTDGRQHTIPIDQGMTGSEMGAAVLTAIAEFGLEGPIDESRFAGDEAREYDHATAMRFFSAFTAAASVFERHRVAIGERVGPIQLWPHGFDLAFEWFGTRLERHGDDLLPAQINLGFYPAGDPYVYSNPWPFSEELTSVPLPDGASWNVEGWQGAKLPYSVVAGAPDGQERILEFARVVHAAAAPGLDAS